MNFSDENDLQASAGEYVLGSLSANERQAFDAELQRNRALAAAVGHWQDRMLRLAPAVVAVEPPAALWQRIERNLPAPGAKSHTTHGGWWNNLWFWRAWGLGGALAVLVLGFLLACPTMRQRSNRCDASFFRCGVRTQ